MSHDLLDTLVNAQHTLMGWGGVPRDGFQQFAKELRGGGGELLRHLSIPQDEYQAFVKLFLVAHVGRPIVQIEQSVDLDRISHCTVRSFAQDSNLGITWEMFEQARNGVPESFIGLSRLLSPFYKPLNEIDIKDCPSKPGHIATRPILSQLGMILPGTVTFDNIQLHKYYNLNESITSINAAILAEQITTTQTAAVPDPVTLLISGKLTQTGERAVLGYHLPWFNSGDPDPCLLFQLSPLHDVFRGGNAVRPGWKIDSDENLIFRESSNGMALVLGKDCKRATVSHHVSGKGMYDATAWRGDWQADVQVEEIEI
ncbi:hypothetical protein SI65_08717 [Aspergillus cristatus]|uniref:Uncharacterized protein n=1 Tax=Aspergillus cristatus TaxID=573508 RepID=A0A1E3B650_ASPCR|nr:hypothetical protein SI65_08717 [Aspergillus cristatus]